jgi:HEAT repeat protein
MKRSSVLLLVALGAGLTGVAPAQEKGADERQPEPVRQCLTLKGHAGEVRAVTFSPDGTLLASGDMAGTLVVWDAARGTKLATVSERGRWWGPVAFTPDGKTVIAGDQDGAVKLWDAATGKAQGELAGHRGLVHLIAFVDDGKTVVTGDGKGTLLFWDAATRKELPGRQFNVGDNLALAITPDGKTLISTGTYDRSARLKAWDATAPRQTATLAGHRGGVIALALTPDGKTLASSAHGGEVRLWDLAQGKPRAALVGHTNDVFGVAVTADGKTVVTGSLDETVKLWDAATGGERLTLEGERGAGMVLAVAVAPDGKAVAAGCKNKAVTLWRLSQSATAFAAREPKPDKTSPKLSDKERRAIREAAEALAARGPEGVAALAKELREGDEERKAAALLALRTLGPDAGPAVDAIVPVLKSEDLGLKRLAVATLKAVGPKAKAALPALYEAAKETRDFDGSIAFGGSSNVAEAALEAVRAIDGTALPELAAAMVPGLVRVLEKGRQGPVDNALRLLRDLGPLAKPALPKLKDALADLPPHSVREVVPVFLASGEDGMVILAEFVLDPKTGGEMKVALMEGYRWRKESTPSTVRILRALLADESPAVRVAAVTTLQTVRAKELIPRLAELLEDAALPKVSSHIKGDDTYYVARALGNQGKDAVPALTKALGHELPLARFQAARALAALGKDAGDAVPALEKLLKDPLPAVRIEAAKAVLKTGKAGGPAQEQLEKYLDPESEFLPAALEAARELGTAGRPLFAAVKRAALESPKPSVQRAGLYALQGMQADGKEVVRVWAKLLAKDPGFLNHPPHEELRAHAAEVKDVVPQLVEYLKAPEVNTRRRVTEVLADMGPAATAAIPALIDALAGDSFVAHGAMEALGAMGSEAKPAVGPLLRKFERIKDDDREADYDRRTVLTALERIGPGAAEAVPRLLGWLPEHPQAARVLGKIGPGAKAALPALEKMYRDGKGYGKTWAAFALVKITGKTEPYVPHLAEVFQQGKDPARRREALEALVELGPDARAALPALLRAVKEKGPREFGGHEFRHEAARALVHFGPGAREAVPDLIDMVKTSYYAAKLAAVEALGAIGPDAKEAVPALSQLAEEDERFRPAVEKALAKIR